MGGKIVASNAAITSVVQRGWQGTARTNYLRSSHNLNGSWSLNDVTVATGIIGPDGTTSQKIIQSATTAYHYMGGNPVGKVAAGGPTVACAVVKDNGNKNIQLGLGTGGNDAGANFDIVAGTVRSVFGSTTAQIIGLGNGWYRCLVFTTTTLGADNCLLRLQDNAGSGSFLGDGASGIYFQSGGVTGGTVDGPDILVPSTTAVTVYEQTLSQSSRTNLSKYSQDLTQTGTWARTAIASVGSGYTDPAGGSTCCRIVEDTSTAQFRILRQAIASLSANTYYTITVYIDKNSTRWLLLEMGETSARWVNDYPWAIFNPATGSFGTIAAGVTDHTVSDTGTGFWKVTISGLTSATGGNDTPCIVLIKDNSYSSYTGDGSWIGATDVQYEVGRVATSYIPTTTAAASITDYSYTGAGVVTLGQTASGSYFYSGSGTLAKSGALNSFPMNAAPMNGVPPSVSSGVLTPSTGTITLAGQSPSIALTPITASVTLAGQSPSIALTPTAASVTLAGQSPSIALTPTAGSLALAGQYPTITATGSYTPTAGAIALSGQTPSITMTLTPTTGTISLAGQTPSQALVLTPSGGALTLLGLAATILMTLTPTVGALTITGNSPSISLTPTAGAITLAGQTPALGAQIVPTTGTIALAGQTPTITSTLTPTTGTIALAGQTPSKTLGLTPTAGAISLAGLTPSITNGVGPAAGAVTLAGQSPSLSLSPTSGAITLAGQTPSLSGSISLTPTTGALTLAGQYPTRSLTPSTGTLSLAGQTPTLLRGFQPTTGPLALNGGQPSISLTPGTGTLTLAGNAPSVSLMPTTGTLALVGNVPTVIVFFHLTADPAFLVTIPARSYTATIPSRTYTASIAWRNYGVAIPARSYSALIPARIYKVTLT